MVGFAHYVFDDIAFNLLTLKTKNKEKVITVKENTLYVINKDNELYTESEFDNFNNIKIDNRDKYEEIINNFIKFIMNK